LSNWSIVHTVLYRQVGLQQEREATSKQEEHLQKTLYQRDHSDDRDQSYSVITANIRDLSSLRSVKNIEPTKLTGEKKTYFQYIDWSTLPKSRSSLLDTHHIKIYPSADRRWLLNKKNFKPK